MVSLKFACTRRRFGLTSYIYKPRRFIERLYFDEIGNPAQTICCAGFELNAWRCIPFAEHLIEWLPEYALPEDELAVTHANMYVKLKQAAIRVYTSDKYKNRGEVGEITLHAICRDYFDTLPISPRVFYKSATNDVVKRSIWYMLDFPLAAESSSGSENLSFTRTPKKPSRMRSSP
jgi:hypothetical protein